MMDVLLVFGFLLLVVTLVGHGIWVFVAFVLRGFSEPYQTPRTITPSGPPKRECPHCGSQCAATFQNCPTCGKPVAEQSRSPAANLESLQRQLDRLLAEDVLTLEQFESARAILRQAEEKHQTPAVENIPAKESSELPDLEAADVSQTLPAAEQIFNLPIPAVKHEPVELPPHKRAAWTDWLQAFLEEKNIRWGELLAGLLIVGSSFGLVISLWSTLRNAIPYFPALCFLAVTAAIHGTGLYTLKHWRLKTTSRGLLTIALLLVPLNFLAAIALSEQRSETDPLYLTAVAIGVVAYGWITWSGSRELMQFGAPWLALAVLGERDRPVGHRSHDITGLDHIRVEPIVRVAAADLRDRAAPRIALRRAVATTDATPRRKLVSPAGHHVPFALRRAGAVAVEVAGDPRHAQPAVTVCEPRGRDGRRPRRAIAVAQVRSSAFRRQHATT